MRMPVAMEGGKVALIQLKSEAMQLIQVIRRDVHGHCDMSEGLGF